MNVQCSPVIKLASQNNIINSIILRLANVYGPSLTESIAESRGVLNKLTRMRLEGGKIQIYGDGNNRILTGAQETCDINTFRWWISDRGASVRVPWQVTVDGKGYLEDRRPSANMDPYLVCHKLIETICGRK